VGQTHKSDNLFPYNQQ
jgi:hypothetical protein